MQGTNKLQEAAASSLVAQAMHALEHALPRGTLFCCLISVPEPVGLNTIASNMPINERLAMMKDAAQEQGFDLAARHDMRAGRPPQR